MDVVKIVLTSVKLALLVAIVVALFQIKGELSQINSAMSGQKVCAFAGKMKTKDCKAKKAKKAKKEKIGKDLSGDWKASKELVEQKLSKAKELLQTKEGEEKSELAAKYKQLKAAVEEEDADFNDLFKEVKVLIKNLK